LRRVADRIAGAIELLELTGEPRALATELLRPLRRIPNSRIFELARDFF